MATSGNTIKLLTRDDIINAALRKLVVISEGTTASTAQITNGAEALNIIVSEFRTFGMQVWARSDMNITLVNGQGTYTIGVGQAVNTPYPTFIYSVLLEQPPYDTQIEVMPRAKTDFNLLPFGSTGVPVSYTYQPQVNMGLLSVWPTPDASVPVGTRLFITYQRPIEVFDAAADNPDFPQEWGNALIYTLALTLADEYGQPEAKKAWLEKQADRHLATALSNTNEQGSVFFQKDWQGN